MTRSWNARRRNKRYERAGSVVLNTVALGQAPLSLAKFRWRHRRLWLLGMVVVTVGVLAAWLTMDSRFYIYGAQITGARRLSHEEIFEASGLRGLHVFWARSGPVESRILEALPALEHVEVSCRLPSECAVAVVERRPRVLWEEGGQQWWVDEEGAVFPALDGEEDLEHGGNLDGIWTVVGHLPRDEDGSLPDEVRVALAELWKSGRDLPGTFEFGAGEGLSFVDGRGWRVRVGQGPGMAERLQVWEQIAMHLESHQQTVRLVDVRFPRAPYYVPAAD